MILTLHLLLDLEHLLRPQVERLEALGVVVAQLVLGVRPVLLGGGLEDGVAGDDATR
jgi:hypothetical protein